MKQKITSCHLLQEAIIHHFSLDPCRALESLGISVGVPPLNTAPPGASCVSQFLAGMKTSSSKRSLSDLGVATPRAALRWRKKMAIDVQQIGTILRAVAEELDVGPNNLQVNIFSPNWRPAFLQLQTFWWSHPLQCLCLAA